MPDLENDDSDHSDTTLDRDFRSYLSFAEKLVKNKDVKKCRKWFDKLCAKIYPDNEAKIRRNAYLKRLIIALIRNQLVYPFDKDPPTGSLSPPCEVFSSEEEHAMSKRSKNDKTQLTENPAGLYSTRRFNDADKTERGLFAGSLPPSRKVFNKNTSNLEYGKTRRTSGETYRVKTALETDFRRKKHGSDYNAVGDLTSESEMFSDSSKENIFSDDITSHIRLSKNRRIRTPREISEDSLYGNLRRRSRSVDSDMFGAKTSISRNFTGRTFGSSKDDQNFGANRRQGTVSSNNSPLPVLNTRKPDSSSRQTGGETTARKTASKDAKITGLLAVTKSQKPVAIQKTSHNFAFPNDTGLYKNLTIQIKKLPNLFEENFDTVVENRFTKPFYERQNEEPEKLANFFGYSDKPGCEHLKADCRAAFFQSPSEKDESKTGALRQRALSAFSETPSKPVRKLAAGFDEPDPPKPGQKRFQNQSRQDRKRGSTVSRGELKTRYVQYRSRTGGSERTSMTRELEPEPPGSNLIRDTPTSSRLEVELTSASAPMVGSNHLGPAKQNENTSPTKNFNLQHGQNKRPQDSQVDVEKISLTTAHDEFCSKQAGNAQDMTCELYRAYPEPFVDKLLEMWKKEGQLVIIDYEELFKHKVEEMKTAVQEDSKEMSCKIQGGQEELRRWEACKAELDRKMKAIALIDGDEEQQKQLIEALKAEIAEEKTKFTLEAHLNSKLKTVITKLSQDEHGQCGGIKPLKDELKKLSDRLYSELVKVCKEYQAQRTVLNKII